MWIFIGRCPEHEDLCLISKSTVQEDGKQRMKKWVSLGQPHLVLMFRFSEPAGPRKSAERTGRLKDGPGLNEENSECAAFETGLELRQELNTLFIRRQCMMPCDQVG